MLHKHMKHIQNRTLLVPRPCTTELCSSSLEYQTHPPLHSSLTIPPSLQRASLSSSTSFKGTRFFASTPSFTTSAEVLPLSHLQESQSFPCRSQSSWRWRRPGTTLGHKVKPAASPLTPPPAVGLLFGNLANCILFSSLVTKCGCNFQSVREILRLD